MRLGIAGARRFSGGYGPMAVLSAVVLAISVTVSLLHSPTASDSPDMAAPNTVPELRFEDADDNSLSLADFRGRVVLLNVWATWCAPCRKEMPALDRLQAKLGGPDFQVLALSMDRGGPEKVRRFFDEIDIRSLGIYLDQNSSAMSTLVIRGVPTTLLIDREGREVQRWVGPAEWDSPDMQALIRRQMAVAVSSNEISRSNPKVKQ